MTWKWTRGHGSGRTGMDMDMKIDMDTDVDTDMDMDTAMDTARMVKIFLTIQKLVYSLIEWSGA